MYIFKQYIVTGVSQHSGLYTSHNATHSFQWTLMLCQQPSKSVILIYTFLKQDNPSMSSHHLTAHLTVSLSLLKTLCRATEDITTVVYRLAGVCYDKYILTLLTSPIKEQKLRR